jgi:hypothetical protein
MERRTFMAFAAGTLLVSPRAAMAQQTGKAQRMPMSLPGDDPAVTVALAALGANSWIRANPKMRTAYRPAISASAAKPEQNPAVQIANPVNRTYSGCCGGNGVVVSWGGGHGSHPGNEFDVLTVGQNQWSVSWKPELPANGSKIASIIGGAGSAVSDLTPLGRMYTQHSYMRQCLDRKRMRVILLVNAGTFAYDLASKTLTRLGSGPAGDMASVGIGYHEGLDLVLCFLGAPMGRDPRGVYQMTPEGAWRPVGDFSRFPALPGLDGNGNPWRPGDNSWNYTEKYVRYDPDQKFMLMMNESRAFTYRVEDHSITPRPKADAGYPVNFDYDRKRKKWLILRAPGPADGPNPAFPLVLRTWDAATNTQEVVLTTGGPTALEGAGPERNGLVYDDAHDVFVFLKTRSQYGNIPAGYECQGGDTETWWYRL